MNSAKNQEMLDEQARTLVVGVIQYFRKKRANNGASFSVDKAFKTSV